MKPVSLHKQWAWRRGLRAETIAVWLLRLKGYRILERRLKTPVGEIDVLARRGNVLAVVEVKARATEEAAAFAISDYQWWRLSRAVDWWLAGRWRAPLPTIRYDALFILPHRLPIHVRDAWRP